MSRSAETGGGSRPSLTKSADRENAGYSPSKGHLLKTPVTARDGVRLRREGTRETMHGTEALDVRTALHAFHDYLRDKEDVSLVFEDPETGSRVLGENAHRWTESYENREYALLCDFERGLRADYGKNATVALTTLSGSSRLEDGAPRPLLDHLDDVLEGYEPAMRAVHRELEERGLEWEYVRILEPHKSGYIHVHVGVFVRGVVPAEAFQPMMDAHVRNSPIAGEEAHQIRPDEPSRSAVSLHRIGTDRETGDLESVSSYLSEYLGTFDEDPREAPFHKQVADMALWLSGRRRRVFSQGARRYTSRALPVVESPWVFAGLEDGEGEFHEVPSGGGGVDMVTTWTADRGPPPPSGERHETRQTRLR